MSDRGTTAGFASRFLAFAIDVVLVSIVLAAGAWFFGRVGAMLRLSAPGWLDPAKSWLSGTIAFLAAAAYFTIGWAAFGQTFGKAFMGLRVATPTGERPGLPRAALRFVGYLISALPLYLGFVWILFDDRRLGWHDHIARTRVVYSRKRWTPVTPEVPAARR
ncbi:MAG: RDD family protein [Actinomycetota bacterium]